MLFVLRAVDAEPTDNHWFQLQRRTFSASAVAPLVNSPTAPTLEAAQVRVTEGLCRDCSHFIGAVVACNLFLAFLALAVYSILNALGPPGICTWQTRTIPPVVGFALGFLLPPVIVKAFSSVMPEPMAPVGNSFWWPCLAGALMLLTPAIVLRFAARSLSTVVAGLHTNGRWGMACTAVAFGECGFWCQPALIYLGGQAIGILVPLGLAATLILYLFGRAMDPLDRAPTTLVVLSVLLSFVFGLGAFLASPTVLWVDVVISSLVLVGFVFVDRHRSEMAAKGRTASEKHVTLVETRETPKSLQELRIRSQSPSYQSAKSFESARAHLDGYGEGKTVWLVLCGSSGAGKTATAEQLIANMQAGNNNIKVLKGICRQDAPPYHPFRESFAEIWASIAPDSQPQSATIDSVLQELVGMFVPFWSLLSGLGPANGASASPSDLCAAVSGTLRKLAENRGLILFIDNVQWLDPGSAVVLRHLQDRFPPGGAIPLVLLLSGRDETILKSLGINGCMVSIPLPLPAEQVKILIDGLGIEPDSAQQIVSTLGVVAEEPGGLFWLGQAVVELVDAGAIRPTDRGFALQPSDSPANKLPVPKDLRQRLVAKLRESSEHQVILECAALLGHVFQVGDLAGALALDRLELLQILHRLEHDRRIFRDVPGSDDLYAFSSAFMLEVIRQEFGIAAIDGPVQQPSKIAKELHARIAKTLEQQDLESAPVIYALARHYHSAGAKYAGKSLETSLRAARAARGEFAFDDARRFLAMAAESSSVAQDNHRLQCEALLIDCDEAHVTGTNRLTVAARGLEMLDQQRRRTMN